MPQWLLALVGAWKAGAAVVPVSPMYTPRERAVMLEDSGARVLIVLEGSRASADRSTRHHDLGARPARRARPAPQLPAWSARPGGLDLLDLIARYAGAAPTSVPPAPEDIALLTYTSGTTGPPKGAMNTHANVAFNAQTYRDWIGLTSDDVVLAIAPLFHITGLVGHWRSGMLTPMPLVLAYRFDAAETLRLAERHGATFTIAAITAFIALLRHDGAASCRADEGVLRRRADRARGRRGVRAPLRRLHPQHLRADGDDVAVARGAVRRGGRRSTRRSGALSVGVPVFDTDSRIVGEDGRELPVGEVGEIVTRGPQVVPGYWGRRGDRASSTGAAHRRRRLHGRRRLVLLVDRKKDQINASGYKVWPREVEDVLYEHPASARSRSSACRTPTRRDGQGGREARARATAGAEELIEFTRDRLAAYKRPRIVEFMDELPKTSTGKILRRALRDE